MALTGSHGNINKLAERAPELLHKSSKLIMSCSILLRPPSLSRQAFTVWKILPAPDDSGIMKLQTKRGSSAVVPRSEAMPELPVVRLGYTFVTHEARRKVG